MIATGVEYDRATEVLAKTGGHVKSAIVMLKAGVSLDEARRRIDAAGGFVRGAIEGTGSARK
jgi:N-acetylmuramic acid 6-phosphate etherase